MAGWIFVGELGALPPGKYCPLCGALNHAEGHTAVPWVPDDAEPGHEYLLVTCPTADAAQYPWSRGGALPSGKAA